MDSRANGPATAADSASQEHGTAAGARRPSVAIIGAGVSGLTAAYLLSRTHDVTGHLTHVDRVVIATHADQALGLLTDPSDEEVSTLEQFGYSRNVTVLHTDSSVLPDAARARACWNYRMTSCGRPD